MSTGRTPPLSDLSDAQVDDLGRVAAAEALGVSYRTLVACCDSMLVSPRMRRAREECTDAAIGVGDGRTVADTDMLE